LFADYSDPDMIRDGRDYYLVASSFHLSPSLPVLRSRDLCIGRSCVRDYSRSIPARPPAASTWTGST